MPRKGRGTWCVRAMPARQRARRPRRDVAAVEQHPAALAGRVPASTPNSVVLPAPLGPTTPSASPRRTAQVHTVQHLQATEVLGHTAFGFEDHGVATPSLDIALALAAASR
jgi:hypothetical protein